MRIGVGLVRVIVLIVLVASGVIAPPPVARAGTLDLTGTWTCCGQGGAPAQKWLLTQTGDDLGGQARRPDGSLLGSISGTVRGADVSIYVLDISTGSAVGYGGTATAAAMSGTWSDANRGTSGTWRATKGDPPPDVCPTAAIATARATVGRRRSTSPAADDCLRVVVKLTTPHQGGVAAGDRIKVVVRPTTKSTTGTVTLTVTPPDRRQARLLKPTITDGFSASGDNLVWRFPAAKLSSVSFTVVVRSDATIDDPWADTTLGVVATVVHGGRSAVSSKQVDLLPCGQQPPQIPADRQVAASGWTFRVGVDARYGLAVDDLRLAGLDGARSRLIARRISVPYLQLQTSRTTRAQFETQIRLRPDGVESFGRSRLLKLKVGGTTAGDDTSRVFAVYGIDHLGRSSGSCLLVRLSYEFKRFGTDTNCHPSAKIGYGDIALLKCSQFRPLLEYRFRGTDGERLVEIQTAQRLHLDIDGQARSMAMVQDRDIPSPVPNFILKRWINPIAREARYEVIRHGQAGPWDNFHQRATFGKVDLPADLEDGIVKACVECLHIHWRWGRAAGGDLPGLGGTRPIIPDGSTQDAYVHLIKPRAGEEGMKLERLDDSDRWTPKDPTADGDVAFYWVAGNTQQHDAFFTQWAWAVPRAPAATGAAGGSYALAVPASMDGYVCPLWLT